MAYSELIKNYDKIRDYMRDFYVYGFRTRNDYDAKTSRSARSYDNERRRVESWLSDYMSFRQDGNGKQVFLSVDSRDIAHNPLYKAYKAKSFTDKDIILHFYILDILMDGQALSASEISRRIFDEYLSFFDTDIFPDDSTIRNKLKEYASIGLINTQKLGKEIKYSRAQFDIEDQNLLDAISFAAEDNPVGVIGSFLLDKYEDVPEYFAFKHRYLLEALEEQILVDLLLARKDRLGVEITYRTQKTKQENILHMFPLKIYISTQNGKQYLMGYNYDIKRPKMIRLDHILKVKTLKYEPDHELYDSYAPKYESYLWGTTDGFKNDRTTEHIEFTVHIGDNEEFIYNRLMREKRRGTVTRVDARTASFEADVYDSLELVPWIRTFIGRIESFKCSNKEIEAKFKADIEEMYSIYGGDSDGI